MKNLEALLQSEFTIDYEDNVALMEEVLGKSCDIVKREVIIHEKVDIPCCFFFTDGLADDKQIDKAIRDLQYHVTHLDGTVLGSYDLIRNVQTHLLSDASISQVDCCEAAVEAILSGDTVIIADGFEKVLILSSRGWKTRSVEEPMTESVIRGPREGFTESIRTNTALVRRRIRDPLLHFRAMKIGKRSKTDVNVAFIDGIVKPGLVDEVFQRLERIKIDAILDSGYIEELIEDVPLSPFVTIQSTERPDKVAAALLEGRAAIFVDNSPFVLIVPTYFWQYIQASDDYYSRYWVGTFFRMIRYIAFLLSLTAPSVYVMLLSFHQEMVPTPLALTIASGREVVPFPVLMEALIMEITFELMREAGLRMPRPIGSAMSIVGSLVIGQAAVQAGLVSPFMVIVISITAISSFAIPNYAASFSIRMLRFPLMIASGTLGLLGFAAVFMLLVIHAMSVRSFGEPYFSPATPFRPSDQKDMVFRMPWWMMDKRPHMAKGDMYRQTENQRPGPDHDQGGHESDE
ncbi:spore germination protein [Brevibacillus dissolubilis]|uniref:spore germination protein n=1 Tax=Brevibacillus dissolubilis TaxID=1844116 RepID=UPI0011164B4B|nr:spore germination protein [Brevibacillus dissolubilis]